MMAKKSVFLGTMLLGAGMAFAASGSSYYNLITLTTTTMGGFAGYGYGYTTPTTTTTETLVLSQGTAPCTDAAWTLTYNKMAYVADGKGKVGYNTYGMGWTTTFTSTGVCVGAVEATPENLAILLKEKWAENKTYSGDMLNIGSNIDLGGYTSATAEDECVANHVPLPIPDTTMNSDNRAIDGNNFTIKHLCYVSTDSMKTAVGLFEKADRVTIRNMKLDSVKVHVSGSENGSFYAPAGSLIGRINLSWITNIVLSNVSIDAPFAGGLVGLLENSTISEVTGNDDIFVTNSSKISKGYAGSVAIDAGRNSSIGYTSYVGGLVGMVLRDPARPNASFKNDSIKVEVHNYADSMSALGGLVGLYSGSNDSLVNVRVYNKVKTAETVASKISGGAAMGGLFGVVAPFVQNNTPTYSGSFEIYNSSFGGQISGASAKSGSEIALGGFIGRDSLVSMMLKIDSSRADVAFDETWATSGRYSYYAGGLIGKTSNCGSFKDASDYLSVTNSKVTGSISLDAAVEKLNMQAFVGGFAGAACLSLDGNALTNDTSSVAINVSVRTGGGVVNGSNVYDSVSVGGFLGAVNVANAEELELSNLLFNGSINVVDSVNMVTAGGIVGNFRMASGGKKFALRNVHLENANLLTYDSKSTAKTSSYVTHFSSIGGLCGLCKEVTTVAYVGIKGDINATGAYTDSLLVGGLFGSLVNSDASVMNVNGVFSIGDIEVSKVGVDSVKVGYLFGSAIINGTKTITSIYHKGENDADVEPFGTLFKGTDMTKSWKTDDQITYVVRNAAASKYTGKHHNGTMAADSMVTSYFAGFLNAAYASEEDYVWTYVSGKNDSLPFFADAKNTTIKPTTENSFVVTFVDMNGETIKLQDGVISGQAAVAPTAEEMAEYAENNPIEGYTWNGKWDKTFDAVTADLTVKAKYDTLKYTVEFYGVDGDLLSSWPDIAYGYASVEAPNVESCLANASCAVHLTKTGYKFVGWDDSSYVVVTKDLNINAVFEPIKYEIVFEDYNGNELYRDSLDYDEAVPTPTGLTRVATKEYTYEFNGWKPEVPATVVGNAVYTAVYDSTKVLYEVEFVDAEGKTIGEVQQIAYGDAAAAPVAPERVGYNFAGWTDTSFTKVVENVKTKATYSIKSFSVTFKDYDGDEVTSTSVEYGSVAIAPKNVRRESTKEYNYTFTGWTPELGKVTQNMVYTAVYDSTKVLYEVEFVDADGKTIDSVQQVAYGDAAVAPAAPEREGSVFSRWSDSSYTKVLRDVKVTAKYDTIKYTVTFRDYKDSIIYSDSFNYHANMAIANNMPLERDSSEEYAYMFKGWTPALGVLTQDMDVKAVYDSVYIGFVSSSSSEPESSSSSVEEPESSSSEEELTIAKAKVSVSGSAVCLAINADGAEEGDFAQVFVMDAVGNVIEADVDLASKSACMWEKLDMASGRYVWTLNVSDSVVAEGAFQVNNEIIVASRGWRMVSIAAMDKSTLNDASFYWWDEKNPVGDFWQYKAYAGEDAEETRGFWYGSSAGKTIALKNVSAEVSEDIVWKLDSLYSGWNMVANPYGWKINLASGSTDNGASVKFWKWNPETSSYSNVTVIEPYEAVWAKASESTTFRLPSTPVYNENAGAAPKTPAEMKMAMRKSAARKASASNWTLAVSLADENGKTDSWNVLGAGSEAETMDEPPVGMGERVTLAIRETAKGVKLSKSIKAVAESYEWLLDVSANRARDGKVSFDGVKDLNALGYSLYVTADGVTQELKDGESLPVALKTSAQTVTVRVASAGSMTIASNNLKGFSAIQNAGALQVGFTAPETLAGSRGHYALVSVNGKKIASGNFTATAGSNVLNLNAPKSGLYFMQVKVGSQNMSAKVMVK